MNPRFMKVPQVGATLRAAASVSGGHATADRRLPRPELSRSVDRDPVRDSSSPVRRRGMVIKRTDGDNVRSGCVRESPGQPFGRGSEPHRWRGCGRNGT